MKNTRGHGSEVTVNLTFQSREVLVTNKSCTTCSLELQSHRWPPRRVTEGGQRTGGPLRAGGAHKGTGIGGANPPLPEASPAGSSALVPRDQ